MIDSSLRQVLGAAIVASTAIAASAATAQTFKLSTNLPAGHSMVKHGIDPWMTCVKQESRGSLDFNFFPGGQIAQQQNSLEAVNKGLVEISMLVPSILSDKLPLSGISMLPDMGDTSLEMAKAFRKVLDGGGPLADEMAANNIKAMFVGMLPAYQLIVKGAPLQSLDQIRGRKIRVAGGLMGLTVRSVGGVAVDIPAGDAYMAVQQGTVDGVVFALSSVQSYKLQEVAKAMSGNGSFGSSPIIIAMDAGVWAKLPADKQKVLTDCGVRIETDMHLALDAENEDLKKQFAAAGVTIFDFSPPVKAELSKRLEAVAREYVTRMSARGVKAEEVYAAYRTALGK